MIKTAKISKASVYEDIDTRTMKLAETALNGVAADNVASDATETMDGSILARYVHMRDALLRKKLAFCLVWDESEEADDSIESQGSFEYRMDFDEPRVDLNLKSVALLIHEYLVHGSIADWLAKGGSGLATSYASDAESVLSELTSILRGSSIIEPTTFVVKRFGRRR